MTSPASELASSPPEPHSTSAWYAPFSPRRGLRSPHLQTIAGNFLRRECPLPIPKPLLTPVPDPDAEAAGYPPTRLLSLCHWQPEAVRRERLTIVLVHGLEGSASSRYVLGNASRAWAAGCNVIRMNMRSCGGSDALAPTIYHSGRSSDVAAVVDALVRDHGVEQIALVGYSMGGNLVLNYAGQAAASTRTVPGIATSHGEETGDEGRRTSASPQPAVAPQLRAVVGVSPLMDLAASSAALHEPQNRIYEWRFLRAMKRRLRAKAALFPALYATLEQEGVYQRIRTMRDFDGEIVARFGGFRDADDYYASVASSRHSATLSTPTLILHAADDPFIRLLPSTRRNLLANPHVTYIETAYGGHCAFLTDPVPPHDSHWAERTLLAWLLGQPSHQP